MTVLVVTKMKDTEVMLMREVASVFTQLFLLIRACMMRGLWVDVQIIGVSCSESTWNRCHYRENHSYEEEVLSVHVLEEFPGSHGRDESDGAHGQEADGCVAR